jgi:hypothetical protein
MWTVPLTSWTFLHSVLDRGNGFIPVIASTNDDLFRVMQVCALVDPSHW